MTKPKRTPSPNDRTAEEYKETAHRLMFTAERLEDELTEARVSLADAVLENERLRDATLGSDSIADALQEEYDALLGLLAQSLFESGLQRLQCPRATIEKHVFDLGQILARSAFVPVVQKYEETKQC